MTISNRGGAYTDPLPSAWASSRIHAVSHRFRQALAVPLIALALPLLSLSSPASAQNAGTSTPPPAPAQQKPPCATPEHRAFDFWVGIWDVTPVGKDAPTAVNRLALAHGGCVLKEDYRTGGGYSGSSISFYDVARKTWHQTWMGMDGGALYIEGGLNDAGQMVLSNVNTPYYRPGDPHSRVTWTPNADGSVRQHWQMSKDAGKTWNTVFDGLYVKRADDSSAD